jgi:hypothetical protein
MEKTINIPYIKKYDKNGKVLNAFQTYIPEGPNRRERRKSDPKKRFIGNGKNLPLTVIGKYKYIRMIQYIRQKDGSIKRIFHYLPM